MNIISLIIIIFVSILGLFAIVWAAYEAISTYRLLKASEEVKEQLIEFCKLKNKENK